MRKKKEKSGKEWREWKVIFCCSEENLKAKNSATHEMMQDGIRCLVKKVIHCCEYRKERTIKNEKKWDNESFVHLCPWFKSRENKTKMISGVKKNWLLWRQEHMKWKKWDSESFVNVHHVLLSKIERSVKDPSNRMGNLGEGKKWRRVNVSENFYLFTGTALMILISGGKNELISFTIEGHWDTTSYFQFTTDLEWN